MEPKEPTEMISLREAARLAGCSYQSVWRAASRGEVPVYRVGEEAGPLRLRRDEFLSWLLESEVTAV